VTTKQETSVWKHTHTVASPPKKVHRVKSVSKIVVEAFFDSRGMVYQHFVPSNTTVNVAYYTSVLKTLRRHINGETSRNHAKLGSSTSWQRTPLFCQTHKWVFETTWHYKDLLIHQISHPVIFGYSADSRDFFEGSNSEAQQSVEEYLKQLPKELFSEAYRKWDRCILHEVRYFQNE